MKEIIWKSFKLGDLFDNKVGRDSSIAQKNLDKSNEYTDEYNISIITESKFNNGIGFFMRKDDDILKGKIIEKGLTYGTQFGNANYHNYKHFIIGNVNYLFIKNEVLNKKCNLNIGNYLAKTINLIFSKSKLFGYGNKIDKLSFNREIILLPTIEVKKEDEWIWHENDKYYTLATDYINSLMDKAKEYREQKTIKSYEAERAKYEAERAKYEALYKIQRDSLTWKSFKLGDLFERSTALALGSNQKDLSIFNEKTENTISLISASRNGSGCIGYIEKKCVDKTKISVNKITFDDQWGFTFFQKEPFVITGGHNAILETKNNKLKKLLDNNLSGYSFLSLIANKITIKSNMFGYGYKINNKFDREIILLPTIEVKKEDEWIWHENDKYYTIASAYISYIYLSGRINYYQKLIDRYTYQY
ncbi:hypothetical protein [Mycoplasma crocodyli]|uniref:Uncharacterized protein n=1 Tax=Mycoplasma crocodyli (strain ATCC 51981 / MP145) TaxID=512564 RepID=D5E5J6_MYCCM|nr:hypothetical protein [Mycoplasma crocodyli]ADE19854.1 hypothetical protein MCRO_0407 [Mycoplasma crocodyli MP145]